MIKAILFDLDGVLCDCTELHYISFNKALQEIVGIEIDRMDHNQHYNGLPTKQKLHLLESKNIIIPNQKTPIWEAKQRYTKQTILDVLHSDDQKIKMHRGIKEQEIKIACITNSIRDTATLMLTQTGQIEFIDMIIANDDIQYPKPNPEGYINGMHRFGVGPKDCLIVEDSPVGLQAAKAAGANIWQVNDCYDVNLSNLLRVLQDYAH